MTKWIYAHASVTGNSHILREIPCQDFSIVEDIENDFLIAIVADGAGSCENSHIGSKNVAELSVEQFKNLILEKEWYLNNKIISEEEWHNLAKTTLKDIKEKLFDLSENQLNVDFVSLSCTLIVVIAFDNKLLITHIGDGRAGYCDENDEWFSMMKPFQGEQPNETVFITSNIWDDNEIDKYIESNIINSEVKAFCLLSDGCEKAAFECNLYDSENNFYFDPNHPHKEFFDKNVNHHLPQLFKMGKTQEEINDLWKNFLESGNQTLINEPDDKTMILVVSQPQCEEN